MSATPDALRRIIDGDPSPRAPAAPPMNQVQAMFEPDALETAAQQDTTPEQAARKLKLAMSTGLPADFIDRNLDELEKQSASASFDAQQYRRQSPIFASWLEEHPDHVAAARDDLENLSGMEWALKAFSRAHSDTWDQIELAKLRNSQLNGEQMSPEQLARIKELKAQPDGGDYGAEHWYSQLITQTGSMLPTTEYSMLEGATMGAEVGLGTGGAALASGVGAPAAAPIAMTAFEVGSVAGTFKATQTLEAGLAYDELLDLRDENGKPMDDNVARTAAQMVGAINGALEFAATATFLKYIPGMNTVLRSIGMRSVKSSLENR